MGLRHMAITTATTATRTSSTPSSCLTFIQCNAIASMLQSSSLRGRALSTTRPLRARAGAGVSARAAKMSIEKEVSEQMKVAMKSKDAGRLKALRAIRAAFLNVLKSEANKGGDTLSDADAVTALRKLAKMRAESIEMYTKGGRDELADEERAELVVIEEWLPKLASEEQMTAWAKQAIEQSGATTKSQMGKVMGLIMKEHREEADGNVLKKVVSSLLS